MSTSVAKVASSAARNFRVGGKQVFLPNHVITFISPKPTQPPNYATFIVPLRFNKLDLRDYLWHAYKVEVLSVRSFISAKKPISSSEDGKGGRREHKTYRPQSEKKMMAELAKPFVFPSLPEDLSPWDNEIYKDMITSHKAVYDDTVNLQKNGKRVNVAGKPVNNERISLARQAEALRRGDQWTNDVALDEKWLEVEKDVQLSPRK